MKTHVDVNALITKYVNACMAGSKDTTLEWAALQEALSQMYAESDASADLRAHIGDLEEERNQARENEAVALRDQNDIEIRLDEALARAQAFEAALLVVLKMRESGTDEHVRRVGELLEELQTAREAVGRTIARCIAVTEERALGATPGDVCREIAKRIRALKGSAA